MNSWLQKNWGRAESRKLSQRASRVRARSHRRALVEQLEDRSMMALVSPGLDTMIEAVNTDQNAFNNNGFPTVPPDTHGTVGPNHVLNATNQSIQWFTKDGVQQAHSSLSNFFAPLFPAGSLGPFDPKVIYDHYSGRYFVVALEVLDVSSDPINSSRVLLAVSDDSDPNGSWNFQAINSSLNIGGSAMWLDYPGLGYDDKAIYITGNMFPFSDGTSPSPFGGGSRLWIIDKGLGKGGLYDGGTSVATVHNPAGTFAATTGFTLQPATMYSPGPTFGNGGNQVGTYMAAYNGNSSGGTENVLLIRVDNPLAATPTFTLQTVNVGDIDDTLNTAFPADPGPFGLPGAPQMGTPTLLNFGDRRMMHVVWRNNQLYATTQVIPPAGADTNQVTVHWFRFDTSNPNQITLADQGNVGGEDVGSNVYTSYGSLAVDKAGNMAIGYAASGPGMYGGAYYAVRAASDPAGTVRKSRALGVGQDSYEAFGDPTRWGDYSAIALDPSDQATFWVYNQYAIARSIGTFVLPPDFGRYGTRWGAFHLSDVTPPTPGGTTTKAYVTGTKWNDANSNGAKDLGEVPVAGFTMYVDLNGNNNIDVGEPAARTDANGKYVIESSSFGTYAIREVPISGWTQIYPGASVGYEHTVTLVSGQTLTGLDFGNTGLSYDFGDAPSPYPTNVAQNGARHAIKAGLHLGGPTVNIPPSATPGVEPDAEANGQPDLNAEGDDLAGVDDEDGVTFPGNSLIAGATTNITVTVSTGGLPSALLQGWIDFNADGDWSDAGEQVVKDLTLTEGVHSVPITVPSTATSATTYARFRYGYERGLSFVGAAIAGEVEDYSLQIISDEPTANPDFATVNQNSAANVVNVLANDFASSSGGLRIQSLGTPNRGGTVVVDNRGTAVTSDDVVLYTPVGGFTGTETFNYTITDNSGGTDTALVTMTVVSLTSDPIAVDDSYFLTQVTPTTLTVLANDVVGNSGPIRVTSVTQPSVGQGTVTIGASGQSLLYTPPSTTFAGDLQFTYTIQDSRATPKVSTAKVTLHVGNSSANDLMKFTLQPYDLSGNAISVINPGQEFELRAFVQDIRTNDGNGNPTDELGVYAAYFDMLYESNLVSLAGPITFGPSFPNLQSGATTTPGMLNESGAFQNTSPTLTANPLLLYSVRMRANNVGQADFTADPADTLPLHDSLLYQPPSPAVSYDQITYGTSSLFIGNPSDVLFKAVDDSLAANSTGNTTLLVLNNDLAGLNGPITITQLTPLGNFQGSIARSNNNTTVSYTAPPAGFTGVQQFRYTISNAIGGTDSAVVTMYVGDKTVLDSDDLVSLRLATTDLTGNAITQITAGSQFQVRAFVDDLRANDGDTTPPDLRGVYAAYLDILYNYRVASVVASALNSQGFEITYSANYTNGKSGDDDVPGLVNEVGAFQTNTSSPLGQNELPLFTITFQANSAGTFTYQGDPRDASPSHDVLLFQPPTAVAIDKIRFNSGTLTINASGGGGEAEYTNPRNPLDVNDDGFVSPIDALLVINNINSYGPRTLPPGGGGEGGSKQFIDVNADMNVSSIDGLIVVNYLNNLPAGEGEATPGDAVFGDASLLADLSLPSSATDVGSTSSGTTLVTNRAADLLVAVLARSQRLLPVVSQTADDSSSIAASQDGADDEESLDDVLDNLADDVAGNW